MDSTEILKQLVELLSKNSTPPQTKRRYTKKEGLTYGAKASGNREHLELYNISKSLQKATTAISRLEQLTSESNVQEYQRPAYLLAATELSNLKRLVKERQQESNPMDTDLGSGASPTSALTSGTLPPPLPASQFSTVAEERPEPPAPPPPLFQAVPEKLEVAEHKMNAETTSDVGAPKLEEIEEEPHAKRPRPTIEGAQPLGLHDGPARDTRGSDATQKQRDRLLKLRSLWNS